jgi:arginine-tRNA-protein transferase
MKDSPLPRAELRCYATAAYPCGYLPEQMARSLVVAPGEALDHAQYSALVAQGFRRSSQFVYRPHCDRCQACIPIRIAAERFEPDRSQRRCLSRLSGSEALNGLIAREVPLAFDAEHYTLYRRYQRGRHPGGGMEVEAPQEYIDHLLDSAVDTRLVEFREARTGRLVMVSVIDVVADGLSAVYTFFEPEAAAAGYGTFGVLWQIAKARELGLPYVYLGYWIAACRKMAYKTRFAGHEIRADGEWRART